MSLYTAPCPSCLSEVEWYNGEQCEDCCEGATLRRVRRIVRAERWPIKRETWRQLRRILL